MSYRNIVANQQYHFADLKTLMAKATPLRSGDELAGVAARDATEHVAAQMTLADVPLKTFLNEVVIDYETDEITRLIIDEHDLAAFTPISHFTVGDFRNWLLGEDATAESLKALASGLTPEMVAAVSKIMRNQDLIYVASKCEVVTQFRNTIGLKGHLSTRLQPNHPTDDVLGISASILDGLMYGNGDAVIGINPATDNLQNLSELLKLLDGFAARHIVITGGEPCMYDLRELTAALLARGRSVQIETSGTHEVLCADGVWVTVSPKLHMPGGLPVLASAMRRANEVKHPVGKLADIEQLLGVLPLVPSGVQVWLQPLSQSSKATELCIAEATQRGWRVSVQTHKFLGVR